MVYYSLGYSYLRYCNIVWGSASKNILKPLIALQNRILRVMAFAPFGRIDIDNLYDKLSLLGLDKIHYLEKAKFMYKYYNNKLSANFDNYFQNQTVVNHSYNLRNRNPPRRQNGIDIWTSIPTEIQSCQTLKSFSTKLKTDILLV